MFLAVLRWVVKTVTRFYVGELADLGVCSCVPGQEVAQRHCKSFCIVWVESVSLFFFFCAFDVGRLFKECQTCTETLVVP